MVSSFPSPLMPLSPFFHPSIIPFYTSFHVLPPLFFCPLQHPLLFVILTLLFHPPPSTHRSLPLLRSLIAFLSCPMPHFLSPLLFLSSSLPLIAGFLFHLIPFFSLSFHLRLQFLTFIYLHLSLSIPPSICALCDAFILFRFLSSLLPFLLPLPPLSHPFQSFLSHPSFSLILTSLHGFLFCLIHSSSPPLHPSISSL